MPQVAQLIGGAGTGKTTELLNIMEQVLARLLDPRLVGREVPMEMRVSQSSTGRLCVVWLNYDEALRLIKSLVNQLLDGPNGGRLESRCTGDATELTIVVQEAPGRS